MELLEQYNLILKREEDHTIGVLNKVLDKSFNRVVRRIRVWLRTENAPKAERDIAILRELRQLVTAVHPGKTDEYDRTFHTSYPPRHRRTVWMSQTPWWARWPAVGPASTFQSRWKRRWQLRSNRMAICANTVNASRRLQRRLLPVE